jgi:hypothetical protein
LECCSNGEWGDARFEGGRDNFIRSISDSVEKALRKIETPGDWCGAGRAGRNMNCHRAGQPVADCLCF